MASAVAIKRKEPAVISIALLEAALEAAAEAEPKHTDAERPRTKLSEATELRLSFRGACRVPARRGLRASAARRAPADGTVTL